MNKLKVFLWKGKEFIKGIFVYPKFQMNPNEEFNYDSYWDKRKKEVGETFGKLNAWQAKRAQMVINFLSKARDITIADVASGSGNILKYIKDNVSTKNVIAYDFSPDSVKTAKENGLNAEILDVSNLDNLSTISVHDYFLLFEILEHLPNSELVLNKIYSKANKGVFLSVPNTGFVSHRLRMIFGRFPMQWRQFPNEHVRFWTLKDMHWWLRALGFKKYKVISYMGVPILKNILPNLFAAGIFVYIEREN